MQKIPKFKPRVVDQEWRELWRKFDRVYGTPVPGLPKHRMKESGITPDYALGEMEHCPICGRPMASPVPDPVYGKVCYFCGLRRTRLRAEAAGRR